MSHLQYVDDTIILGVPLVDNLLTIKVILRSVESVSELKVNFAKSCLFGVNVYRPFMNRPYEFLQCKVGSLPFKYLGLSMDVNQRKKWTRDPLFKLVYKEIGFFEEYIYES